jgi:hypothetical protein
MNDQLNTNAGSNQATGNDDRSHEGANMEKVVNSTINDTESAAVSGKKTRSAYDGSYAHGVTADIEHITTILEYKKALGRLKTRRNYLVKEYQNLGRKYAETEDVIERAELLKDKSSKESQINTVDKTRKDLEELEDSIKSAERAAQDAVSFKPYEIED